MFKTKALHVIGTANKSQVEHGALVAEVDLFRAQHFLSMLLPKEPLTVLAQSQEQATT